MDANTFETGGKIVDGECVSVIMTCCGNSYPTVADTLDHECPATPTEPVWSGNRVWTVRAGDDGMGLDLFHVYAASMDDARASARDAGVAMGFVFGDRFTVHAHRDGEEIPWFARLGHNVVTDRAALDFHEFAETHR